MPPPPKKWKYGYCGPREQVLDGLGHGLIFQDALAVNEHLASHIQAGEDYFQKKPAVISKL